MRKVNNKKLFLTIAILIAVSFIIFRIPENIQTIEKKYPLRNYLDKVPGFQNGGDIPLDASIIEELKLDDYVFRRYKNGETTVTLYIGYYYSIQKVGAAHDPLVCFPGQGWELTNRQTEELQWQTERFYSLPYASMTGKIGQNYELIAYWFQSYDQTSSSTLSQKLMLLKNTIMHLGSDNAFCRVTVSMKNSSDKNVVKIAEDFIKNVYPLFLDYVMNGRQK